jgi:integrase
MWPRQRPVARCHAADYGRLAVRQGKGGKKRRIIIEGRLAEVIERIKQRKRGYKVWSSALAINSRGMALTEAVLRKGFVAARLAAAEKARAAGDEKFAADIAAFWFYDLRAKAADDIAETHGDQAATDLLGHDNVKTTKDHYLRRGKIVGPSR